MKAPKKYFSGLTRDSFLLAFVSLFSDIATEMLYPVLPIFLTQTLKAGGSIVGLVEGIAQATQFMVQGVSGYLSDKLGRRKPIALFGYIVSTLSKPLIGLSGVWQAVLGARFLDRLGTGTRSAPRDALIASSAAEESRGKAFGIEGVGDNLGAFLGPLVAIFFLFSLHTDIRQIFYIAAIPGAFSVLLLLFVKERSRVVPVPITLEKKYFPKDYWKYLLVTAIFGIGNSSNAFLILQTRSIGVPLEATILIYAFFNLVASLISYPSGSLSDTWGRKNILFFGFVIFIGTYLGFAVTKNIFTITLLFILYGAYQGIFRSVGKALATDLVPAASRGSGIGWYSATVGSSGLIASIVAGLLWDKMGHPAVFIYGAVCGTAGAIALWLLVPKKISR